MLLFSHSRLLKAVLFLNLSIIICSCSQNSPSSKTLRQAKHVVIIGIDGLSKDGVETAETPVLDEMMQNGSFSLHARSVMPSSSGANWGSMLMGAGPEQHGITFNDWRTDNMELPPVVVRNENLFPSIFGVIRDQLNEAKTVAILHWNPIEHFIEKETLTNLYLTSSENATTEKAVEVLKTQKPDFTFIHIDHVDGAGHGQGHGSEAYYKAVTKADSLIGEIILATKEAGIFEETVFFVSADHGGKGFGHGGNSLEEMNIPFIVYGRNVRKNQHVQLPLNIYDIPATALFALGLEQPYEWIARPLKSAFEGEAIPKTMYKLNHLGKAPSITPSGEGGANPAGGLFIGVSPTIEITSTMQNGVIRYTLDGSLPTKTSTRYKSSFKLDRNTVLQAQLFTENGAVLSAMATAYFRIVSNTEDQGLLYHFYELDNELDKLPDFEKLTASKTGKVYEISTNDLVIDPSKSTVGAVFNGFLDIQTEGKYVFYLSSDDGSRMFINGKEVVNNDGNHGVITKSASATLKKGKHPIKIEWFNGGGGYWLGAMIEGPGLVKQIIPPSMLFVTE